METSAQIVKFMIFADRLKSINRAEYIHDNTRRENPAEHTWHILVLWLILCEQIRMDMDALRVVKMIVVHDIPEVLAGDVSVWDEESRKSAAVMEAHAAKSIDTHSEWRDLKVGFLELWREFEDGVTIEAKIARALDKLQGTIQNVCSGGKGLNEHRISKQQFIASLSWVSNLPDEIRSIVSAVVEVVLETEPWKKNNTTADLWPKL